LRSRPEAGGERSGEGDGARISKYAVLPEIFELISILYNKQSLNRVGAGEAMKPNRRATLKYSSPPKVK